MKGLNQAFSLSVQAAPGSTSSPGVPGRTGFPKTSESPLSRRGARRAGCASGVAPRPAQRSETAPPALATAGVAADQASPNVNQRQ